MQIEDLMNRAVLTATEVAEVLSLSKSHVYQSIARGEIYSVKYGRRVVIPTRPLAEKLGLGGVSDLAFGDTDAD